MATGFDTYKPKYASGEGFISIAQNFTLIDDALPADITSANLDTVDGIFQGATYDDVGDFDSYIATLTRENEEEYRSQKCGVGIYATTFDKRATFTFNLLDYFNLDTLNKLAQGLNQTIVSAPVSIADPSQENLGINAVQGATVRLDRKSDDGTVVTGVTINLGGTVNPDGTVTGGSALVDGTDYVVVLDTDGSATGVVGASYISFLTAQTGQLSAEYTYTPANTRYVANLFETVFQNFQTVKFVSCGKDGYDVNNNVDPTKRVIDEIYLHKCTLTSEYPIQFYGQEETFEGASITLTGLDGGLLFNKRFEQTI